MIHQEKMHFLIRYKVYPSLFKKSCVLVDDYRCDKEQQRFQNQQSDEEFEMHSDENDQTLLQQVNLVRVGC